MTIKSEIFDLDNNVWGDSYARLKAIAKAVQHDISRAPGVYKIVNVYVEGDTYSLSDPVCTYALLPCVEEIDGRIVASGLVWKCHQTYRPFYYEMLQCGRKPIEISRIGNELFEALKSTLESAGIEMDVNGYGKHVMMVEYDSNADVPREIIQNLPSQVFRDICVI